MGSELRQVERQWLPSKVLCYKYRGRLFLVTSTPPQDFLPVFLQKTLLWKLPLMLAVDMCTGFGSPRDGTGLLPPCVSEGGFTENGDKFMALKSITMYKNTRRGLDALSHCFSDPWKPVKLLWFQKYSVLKLLYSWDIVADFAQRLKKKKTILTSYRCVEWYT